LSCVMIGLFFYFHFVYFVPETNALIQQRNEALFCPLFTVTSRVLHCIAFLWALPLGGTYAPAVCHSFSEGVLHFKGCSSTSVSEAKVGGPWGILPKVTDFRNVFLP